MNWMETGRFLIVAGAVLVILGLVFALADKIPLGHLPGDIVLGGKRLKIYFPVATCILLSIVLTLMLNFFSKRLIGILIFGKGVFYHNFHLKRYW